MATKKKIAEPKKIYQIKVTLKDTKPPIWRRIEVTEDTSLDKLHNIIQAAIGWNDYHLHQFIIGGNYYGKPDPEFGSEMEDESTIRLSQISLKEKSKFTYEYDFGDSWLHEILIEKILPAKEGVKYPVCITGKRACPPEDVGGSFGYADFLETINDPEHPEHEDMLEWAGDDFDPEAFDLDEINARLAKMR